LMFRRADELNSQHSYLRANSTGANRVSFRHFIRFLDLTDRGPPTEVAALAAVP